MDAFLFSERLLLIGEDGANLVTRSKPIAFFADGQYWVNNHAHCIDATDKILLNYVKFYINAIDLKPYVTGSAQPKITQDKLNSILIPIPPYNEQLKICAKLQKTFEYIDNIEMNKLAIKELIVNTKAHILDLAIRGQLVPQDPNDEPVSVLLEHIREEKEKLIEQGKIKREKKESVIFKADDNSYYEKIGDKVFCIDADIPFELPKGWAFTRLKSAWSLISGRDLSPSEYNDESNGTPYITGASNFENGQVNIIRWTCVPQVFTYKGDLLLTCKGTVGEIAINNFGKAHIARQIMALRNIYNLNIEFLALCIEYSMVEIKHAAKGLIPGISRDDILNLIIPIPPANQQKEIVRYTKIYFEKLNVISRILN